MTRFSAFSLVLLGLLSATSCKKDPEPEREKFLGTYSVQENCNPNLPFDMKVFESGDAENAITITNFGNFAHNVTAIVSGNALIIDPQTFTFNNINPPVAITLSGNGSLVDNTMTIVYSWMSPTSGGEITCIMTCTKE